MIKPPDRDMGFSLRPHHFDRMNAAPAGSFRGTARSVDPARSRGATMQEDAAAKLDTAFRDAVNKAGR
jgi:hypothetical protein